MKTRRRRHHEQQQVTRRIQRDRRRLGRFVAFAEIEADLRPILLFEPTQADKEGAAADRGDDRADEQ